jgi:hypothetical protein
MIVTLLLDTSALVHYARRMDLRSGYVAELIAAAAEDRDAFIGIPALCCIDAASQLDANDLAPLLDLAEHATVVSVDVPPAADLMRMAVGLQISATVAALLLAAETHSQALIATYEPATLRKHMPEPRRVLDLESEYPDETYELPE